MNNSNTYTIVAVYRGLPLLNIHYKPQHTSNERDLLHLLANLSLIALNTFVVNIKMSGWPSGLRR